MQKEYCRYKSTRYIKFMLLRRERAKRWRNAVKSKDKNAILLEDLGERITRCRNQAV